MVRFKQRTVDNDNEYTSRLLKELMNAYKREPRYLSSPVGYFATRGLRREEIEETDLFSFFENTADPKHKKCLVNEEGKIKRGLLSYTTNDLTPLYIGTLATQRSVVAEAFQWYSTLISTYYILISALSRRYKVPPNTMDILNSPVVPNNLKDRLNMKRLALRYIAFTIYEGYGLSGYSPNLWVFFCLITGEGTYTLPVKESEIPFYVNDSEARKLRAFLMEEEENYLKSSVNPNNSNVENLAFQLFRQQWLKLDPSITNIEIINEAGETSSIAEPLVKEIYNSWALTRIYRELERGVQVEAPISDIGLAVLAGFVRRSAKGRITNTGSLLDIDFSEIYLDEDEKFYFIKDRNPDGQPSLNNDIYSFLNVDGASPVPLFLYMQHYWETMREQKSSLYYRLTDDLGNLSPFGELVDSLYEETKKRLRAIREIANRNTILKESEGDQAMSFIKQWNETGSSYRIN